MSRRSESTVPRSPGSGAQPVARTGGRSARVVAAVLEATMEELAARGYGALSIEAVADRAGVAKTTVYRRWPTRALLVRAALDSENARGPKLPDLGSLEADLTQFFFESMRWKNSDRGRAIHRVILAESEDPELWQLVQELRIERRKAPLALLARAEERGDAPKGLDVDYLLDSLVSMTHYRASVLRRDIPRPEVALIVARSLVGATVPGPAPKTKI